MEKRSYRRIPARLEAKFTLEGKKYAGSIDRLSGYGIKWNTYTGVIENLSEGGINLRISPTKTAIDFSPKTTLKLQFQTLFKEIFNLHCMVKWSNETQRRIGINGIGIDPDLKFTSTGMEIIAPSSEYKKFIKTKLKQHI
jgi:hypothetical protein